MRRRTNKFYDNFSGLSFDRRKSRVVLKKKKKRKLLKRSISRNKKRYRQHVNIRFPGCIVPRLQSRGSADSSFVSHSESPRSRHFRISEAVHCARPFSRRSLPALSSSSSPIIPPQPRFSFSSISLSVLEVLSSRGNASRGLGREAAAEGVVVGGSREANRRG